MGLQRLCFQILMRSPNSTGSALLVAAYKAHNDIVRDILQDPGNVIHAMPAFMSISFTGNISTARLLLDAEERIGGKDNAAFCALPLVIGACLSSTVRIAQLLTELWENPPVLEFSMVQTIEALRHRVNQRREDSLPLEKLDTMARTRGVTAWSPFMIASAAGHEDMIRFTIENNPFGDTRVSELEVFVEFMSLSGHINALRILYSLPEQLNTNDALVAACFSDNRDVINFLLNNYDRLPNSLPTGGGRLGTPISLAASLGRVAIAQLFIDKGASCSSAHASSRTPLHWAVDGGYEDMARWLLSVMSSEEVTYRDEGGHSALDIAC
jgi:hypothetical protein